MPSSVAQKYTIGEASSPSTACLSQSVYAAIVTPVASAQPAPGAPARTAGAASQKIAATTIAPPASASRARALAQQHHRRGRGQQWPGAARQRVDERQVAVAVAALEAREVDRVDHAGARHEGHCGHARRRGGREHQRRRREQAAPMTDASHTNAVPPPGAVFATRFQSAWAPAATSTSASAAADTR